MAARCGNPSNSDQVILSGPQRSINRKADSQDDSQLAVQLRKRPDNLGIGKVITELRRTLMDCRGRQTCGLQNRLRGAAEASWVGSIPIHPRHFPGL